MNDPRLEIVGVHPVRAREDLVREQATILCGDALEGTELAEALARAREQIESAVLVEVLVSNPDRRFRVDDFVQKDEAKPESSWQAPYAEAYLTEDGLTLLSRWELPSSLPKRFRVAFFLHYWKPNVALQTTYGQLACPEPTSMPNRLSALVPYEPTD